MATGSEALSTITCFVSIGKKGGTAYDFSTQISNYDKSGFNREVEHERSMGAYLENKKPITSGEISFDVRSNVNSSTSFLTFESIVGSASVPASGIRQNTLEEEYDDYKIKVDFLSTSGTLGTTDVAYKEIFYNCKGVSFERGAEAGNYLNGTIKFTLAPFNDVGSSNYIDISKTSGTGSAAYATAENSYDTIMGY